MYSIKASHAVIFYPYIILTNEGDRVCYAGHPSHPSNVLLQPSNITHITLLLLGLGRWTGSTLGSSPEVDGQSIQSTDGWQT